MKITAQILHQALQRASKEAIQENITLGMPWFEVHDGYLIRCEPNGTKTRIRKAVFGVRKYNLPKIIRLKS